MQNSVLIFRNILLSKYDIYLTFQSSTQEKMRDALRKAAHRNRSIVLNSPEIYAANVVALLCKVSLDNTSLVSGEIDLEPFEFGYVLTCERDVTLLELYEFGEVLRELPLFQYIGRQYSTHKTRLANTHKNSRIEAMKETEKRARAMIALSEKVSRGEIQKTPEQERTYQDFLKRRRASKIPYSPPELSVPPPQPSDLWHFKDLDPKEWKQFPRVPVAKKIGSRLYRIDFAGIDNGKPKFKLKKSSR